MRHLISMECTKDNLMPIITFIKSLQKKTTYTHEPINIILLQADVGMGKTYLVSEYCKQFNIISNSPTFSFIHEYNHQIYHYDLFLKKDLNSKMQLLESLNNEGIHFIEWGDEILLQQLQTMGFQCILLKISSSSNYSRIYDIWY